MKRFEEKTYQLHIERVGDHLRVTIPELDNLVVETAPGKTSDGDAFDLAHVCIERASFNMDTAPEGKVSA